MKLRIAGILLLAGLGVPAAQAAEHEVGGEISLGHGFKPEFVESDGDGKYSLFGAKVKVVTDKTWSISVEEAVKAVDQPEKEVVAGDPIIRLAYPTDVLGLTVAYGLLVSPGLSLESREAKYHAAVRPGISVSKVISGLALGAGVTATRHFRRYTLAADGTSTTAYGLGASLSAGYTLGKLSASLGVAYREAVPYEGPHKFGYLNEFSIGHQTTEALSFEVTLSTSDTQMTSDGSDVNEFSVYRQNKTEVYLGATYAL